MSKMFYKQIFMPSELCLGFGNPNIPIGVYYFSI